MSTEDIKIHIPIEVRKLNSLAKAGKNCTNADFKAMWYEKLIKLAKQYNLMDYVTRKLIP